MSTVTIEFHPGLLDGRVVDSYASGAGLLILQATLGVMTTWYVVREVRKIPLLPLFRVTSTAYFETEEAARVRFERDRVRMVRRG